MSSARERLGLMFVLSLRSLAAHKVKSWIVGAIMGFGTFLLVLGSAMVSTIEASMAKSITSSLAGHLQVYDKRAKDDLALFGSGFMGADDIGQISSFKRLKDALAGHPEVQAVIPMGSDFALLSRGNELDRALGALRKALSAGDRDEAARLVEQVKETAKLLEKEQANIYDLTDDKAKVREAIADLKKVRTATLWAGLETDREQTLLFLESHIAPLLEDGRLLYLRYVGTDLDLFAKNFDRFEIIEGQMVPSGERGIVFNNRFYEDIVKMKVARDLDRVKDAVTLEGKLIADDAGLRTKVSQLPRQVNRITYQLTRAEAAEIEERLKVALPDATGTLTEKLEKFLTVDDDNVVERHRLFYELIAPKIDLYEYKVGDYITLQSFTRSGYLKSLNLKLWGIFRFKGLERSELAGGHNLVDMATFRELYGFITAEKKVEIDEIRKTVGLKDVAPESAEAELFGGGSLEEKADVSGFDEFTGSDLKGARERTLVTSRLDQAAIDEGVALNAAVLLKRPEAEREVMAVIQKLLDDQALGLKVIGWQQASGIVGNFIFVIKAVLFIAIAIIFIVALVIINNSMIMATMERVREIGTMRAIGAQKGFVRVMFLFETVTLGLLAGGAGAILGAAAILVLGQIGIPASGDVMIFMFAGPRLYPEVGLVHVLVGVVTIVVVSVIATLYPSGVATQIQPVVAMQGKD